ncbi:MAG: hypothetical protein LBQ77_02035 [Treponema sp.]|jgi:hypothetical protein|nr:hypothetical protein [Treponema sp.]
MKHAIKILCTVILSICLSGCFDIFQHITVNDRGVQQNTIKITVSKGIIRMAESFSSEQSFDDRELDKMLDEIISEEHYQDYSASITKINDTTDIGILLDMAIDYRDKNTVDTINKDNIDFIPKYYRNAMVIHISNSDSSSSQLENNDKINEFSALFGKYRILINKKCINTIDHVGVRTNTGETNIDFLDVYDAYLIEIPISAILAESVDIIMYLKL